MDWKNAIAWWMGVLLQGLLLGVLLALAVVTLSAWTGGIQVFRYEAF